MKAKDEQGVDRNVASGVALVVGALTGLGGILFGWSMKAEAGREAEASEARIRSLEAAEELLENELGRLRDKLGERDEQVVRLAGELRTTRNELERARARRAPAG